MNLRGHQMYRSRIRSELYLTFWFRPDMPQLCIFIHLFSRTMNKVVPATRYHCHCQRQIHWSNWYEKIQIRTDDLFDGEKLFNVNEKVELWGFNFNYSWTCLSTHPFLWSFLEILFILVSYPANTKSSFLIWSVWHRHRQFPIIMN